LSRAFRILFESDILADGANVEAILKTGAKYGLAVEIKTRWRRHGIPVLIGIDTIGPSARLGSTGCRQAL
jgi:hypothetical protein